MHGNTDISHIPLPGVRLAQHHVATDFAEALRLANELGYPLWVRSNGKLDARFCARLNTPDDLPLVYQQAAKRGSAGVVLQHAVDAPLFQVWNHTLFQVSLSDDPPYRLTEGIVTLAREDHPGISHLAAAVASHFTDVFEAEIALTADGLLLTGVWTHPTLPLAVDACCNNAAPATAVCWLTSRSGRVTEVTGIPEAQALPGVQSVQVNVQPGDLLQHVVDQAGRDKLGYVVAIGATPNEALSHARAAAERIQIQTTVML